MNDSVGSGVVALGKKIGGLKKLVEEWDEVLGIGFDMNNNYKSYLQVIFSQANK